MNKRVIAAFLISCIMITIVGCNKVTTNENTTNSSEVTESTEVTSISETTTAETTTEETIEETASSEEISSSASTSASETAAIGKTSVSDQFKKTYKNENLGKVTAKIPKVTIAGVDTTAINKEILNYIKPKAKGNKCSYQYYIGKNYVSIFIEIDAEGWDLEEHYIYNISRETGKKLSQEEMLSLLGLTTASFRSKTKAAIKKMWKKNGWIKGQNKLYKKAISDKTVNSAKVYVNKKGKVSWWVKKMNLGAGADYYEVFGTC